MEVAVFLRESDEIDNEQWYKFSQRFFEKYRDTIIRYFGYEKQMHYTPCRTVNFPRLFIAVMKVLFESGIFGCKKKELTDTLHEVFSLSKESSTIRRWFYETPPEYEDDLITFKNIIITLKNKE